jgi:sterol desaturase/sphingolipid hydroxylase (fatty acid hydroxylase superfamily)
MIRYTDECLTTVETGYWLTDEAEKPRRATQPKSLRIFESPVLELLSRAHPVTPGVWFGPVVVVAWVVSPGRVGLGATAALYAAGVLFFSFFEYALHRFAFHGLIRLAARDARYRFMAFMAHGYHHEFPNDPSRLVMPPMVSWPLALAFTGLFVGLFGGDRALPLLAGAMTGYIAYDWVHYYTHHARPTWRLGKWMRAYHLRHHFQDHDAFYGISSPLWDVVFGTYRSPLPVRKRDLEEQPDA